MRVRWRWRRVRAAIEPIGITISVAINTITPDRFANVRFFFNPWSSAMDFDDKAKTWDSDPVKQERALAVAAAIRRRVPLARARIRLWNGPVEFRPARGPG